MTNKQITGPKWVTTRQAALQAGVSLRTIQLWCDQGVLDHRATVGGHRRIDAEALAEAIKQQTKAGALRRAGLQPLSKQDIIGIRTLVMINPLLPSMEDVVRLVEQTLATKNGFKLAEVPRD